MTEKNYKNKVSFIDENFNSVDIEIEIEDGKFSMNGDYNGGCGQVYDSIAPLDIHQENLIDIWKKYHLNDMKNATKKQEKALESEDFQLFKNKKLALLEKNKKDFERLKEADLIEGEDVRFDDYSENDNTYKREYLQSINLFIDDDYEYDTKWIKRDLPVNFIKLLDITVNAIKKHNESSLKAFTENLSIEDILDGTEDFSQRLNYDTTDSRDIQTRIDRLGVLQDAEKEYPFNDKEAYEEELKLLEELKDDCSNCDEDFKFGITIVKDSYFTEYAEEYAKDCGFMDDRSGHSNPINNHVDWESWADDMKQDYQEIEYLGETYFVR